MKAQVWNIKVCDGVLEMSHGFHYMIKEICVPELKLAINKKACFLVADTYQRHVAKEGQAEMLREFDVTDEQATELTKLAKAIEESTSSEQLVRQTFSDFLE